MDPHSIGADVSSYQGTINWDALYNNSAFVIIKATEGATLTDSQFARNQSEARRVGMPRGYYHFARAADTPDGWNADDEADLFTNHIAAPKPGEWLVLDWEVEFHDPVGWALNWFERVAQNTGSVPGGILYCDIDRLRRYDWQPLFDYGVHLWVANPSNLPVPYSYIMQQYGFKSFPGISGQVDADFYHLDMSTYGTFGWQSPTPPPQPIPMPPQIDPVPPEPVPPPELPPAPPAGFAAWFTSFIAWLKKFLGL